MKKQSIREARESKGLSREELAVMLGVSASTIISWENGQSSPKTPTRIAIGHLLGVEAENLFFTHDNN